MVALSFSYRIGWDGFLVFGFISIVPIVVTLIVLQQHGRRTFGVPAKEERSPRKKEKASAILGRREKTFEPNKDLLGIWVVVFAITCVGGLLGFLWALVVGKHDIVTLANFMIPIGACGCLCCLYKLTLKVDLHEGGLVHSQHGKRRIIKWDDIFSVKQAITEVYRNGCYMRTDYKYTLELEDRTRIVYTNSRLERVEKLANVIIEKTSALILPQVLRDYDKGEVIDFGTLGVSQDGIYYGNTLLEWDDIKGVRISEGYISVSKRGKWFNWCNIAAGNIPNLMVFLSLVNEIVGIKEG